MKPLSTIAAGIALFATALPVAASAQSWQSINTRQARLDQRIDQGVRSGTLNRREATRLRADFRGLTRLEYRYRRTNGLSLAERRDLDRRFDALSQRIRYERQDRQNRR